MNVDNIADAAKLLALLAAIGLVWLVAANLTDRLGGRIRSTV